MLRTCRSLALAITRRRIRASSRRLALLTQCSLVCVALGCGRSSAPAPTTSKTGRDAPETGTVVPPPATSAVTAGRIGLDECYRDADADAGSSGELLLHVAASCAPGMAALSGPSRGAELRFQVEHSERCIRAFAVSDAPAAELVLALEGEQGELRTSRTRHGRVAALPETAALCLDGPGAYRLKARGPSSDTLSLGVWQAR